MSVDRPCETDQRLPQCDGEAGQTMVEYGFVLVGVALVAVAGYQAFGGRVGALVNTVVW
jgi:Flp pilus assembly pilin Flp